ncbi:poly-gamma-glutamate hydrolase family protein [Archangium violaceum]|nr:poly-gamma-glutamate hydrolase family protein [Archangium violaceum]
MLTQAIPGSNVLITAIHGGGIEAGSSELAKAVAGSNYSDLGWLPCRGQPLPGGTRRGLLPRRVFVALGALRAHPEGAQLGGVHGQDELAVDQRHHRVRDRVPHRPRDRQGDGDIVHLPHARVHDRQVRPVRRGLDRADHHRAVRRGARDDLALQRRQGQERLVEGPDVLGEPTVEGRARQVADEAWIPMGHGPRLGEHGVRARVLHVGDEVAEQLIRALRHRVLRSARSAAPSRDPRRSGTRSARPAGPRCTHG